jgi:hypothetical protein
MKTPILVSLLLTIPLAGQAASDLRAPAQPLQLAQFTPLSFNAWRPYNHPEKIVQVGMNKGQVLALAGKPDHDDSYYQGLRGLWSRTSDWYYVREGLNRETALLKFSGDTLVSISITPIQ